MTQPRPLKIAMVVPDDRDEHGRREFAEPVFGSAPNTLLEGLKKERDVEIHAVCCERWNFPDTPQLAPNLHFVGVRVPSWAYLRTFYIGSVLAIRRVLRRLKPDVVHGQGTERYAGLAAAYSGFPNAITILGNMRAVARQRRARPFSFHWLTARLEVIALRKTCGVICNSSYTKSEVQGMTPRTWDAPNALDAEFFAPRTESREKVPLVINLGHIAPYKGQVELLERARALFERGLRFQLEFIGAADAQTEYGRKFLTLAGEAAANGWARHAGVLRRSEIISRLDAASALIHVSREESFGLAVAEALARDLKVFAFRSGGVADVTAGVDGVETFAVDAWDDLQQAFDGWLRAGAPDSRGSSGVMAARYSVAAVAARHMEIYRDILRQTRRATSSE